MANSRVDFIFNGGFGNDSARVSSMRNNLLLDGKATRMLIARKGNLKNEILKQKETVPNGPGRRPGQGRPL